MKTCESIHNEPLIKRINLLKIILIMLIVMVSSCKNKNKDQSDEDIRLAAQKICDNNLILDSHIDWPEYILDKPEDISMQTINGDFDLFRAEKGGLNAVLSVVYISPEFDTGITPKHILVNLHWPLLLQMSEGILTESYSH
jgi:hypothetical protein